MMTVFKRKCVVKRLCGCVLIVFLLCFGGVLVFRDALLSGLLPVLASRMGITLKLERVHVDLSPLLISAEGLQAVWSNGKVDMKMVEVRPSIYHPFVSGIRASEVKGRFSIKGATGREGRGSVGFLHGLRNLELNRVTLEVSAPWGLFSMREGRLFLGRESFLMLGEIGLYKAPWSLDGDFSCSGKRSVLGKSSLGGKGEFVGKVFWNGKEFPVRVHASPIFLDTEGMEIDAHGVTLKFLPFLVVKEGDLSFRNGGGELKASYELPSLKAVSKLFPFQFPRMEGELYISGVMGWRGGDIYYDLAVLGDGLELGRVGVLKGIRAQFQGHLEGRSGDGRFVFNSLHLLRLAFGTLEARDLKGEGRVRWIDWGAEGIDGKLQFQKGMGSLSLSFVFPSLIREEGAILKADIDRFPIGGLGSEGGSFCLHKGVKLRGLVDAHVECEKRRRRWAVVARVLGKEMAFSALNGIEGDGLRASVDLTSDSISTGPWRIRLHLDEGEALYSYWFFDFSKTPWDLSVELLEEGGKICADQAEYKGLAGLAFQGLFCSSGKGEGTLSLNGSSDRLYRLLVSEPMGEEHPYLRQVSLKGGVTGRWFFRRNDRLEVIGDLRWRGGVESKGLSLRGEFSLPILYAPEGKAVGDLRVDSFTVGPVSIKGWDTPLRGAPYKIEGLNGHSFDLFHGKIAWGPFYLWYKDLKRPVLEMRGIGIKGIKLSYLSLPMEVDGGFSGVVGGIDKVILNGGVTFKLARGEVKLKDIWVSSPFTSLMSVGCDINFSHLDLAELTRVTPFGKMMGFIKGSIRNLVVSHGQPEAFALEVETQKVEGVKKRISLEAINSISILGGGGPVSLFLPFFKEFGYSYLGFSCSLENDVFTLHGLKRRDKVEYIVKRGGLTGVDVINRNPDNRISFRDMMERLRRIRRREEDGKD
jgi:hypothetical protein